MKKTYQINHFQINPSVFVPSKKTLLLKPTDGTRTLLNATRDVCSWIDRPTFKVLDLNHPSRETQETEVRMLRQRRPATLLELVASLRREPEVLALTQHQILLFLETHSSVVPLHSRGTIFLLMPQQGYSKGRLCVVRADKVIQGLYTNPPEIWLYFGALDSETVWGDSGHNPPLRFVVPTARWS